MSRRRHSSKTNAPNRSILNHTSKLFDGHDDKTSTRTALFSKLKLSKRSIDAGCTPPIGMLEDTFRICVNLDVNESTSYDVTTYDYEKCEDGNAEIRRNNGLLKIELPSDDILMINEEGSSEQSSPKLDTDSVSDLVGEYFISSVRKASLFETMELETTFDCATECCYPHYGIRNELFKVYNEFNVRDVNSIIPSINRNIPFSISMLRERAQVGPTNLTQIREGINAELKQLNERVQSQPMKYASRVAVLCREFLSLHLYSRYGRAPIFVETKDFSPAPFLLPELKLRSNNSVTLVITSSNRMSYWKEVSAVPLKQTCGAELLACIKNRRLSPGAYLLSIENFNSNLKLSRLLRSSNIVMDLSVNSLLNNWTPTARALARKKSGHLIFIQRRLSTFAKEKEQLLLELLFPNYDSFHDLRRCGALVPSAIQREVFEPSSALSAWIYDMLVFHPLCVSHPVPLLYKCNSHSLWKEAALASLPKVIDICQSNNRQCCIMVFCQQDYDYITKNFFQYEFGDVFSELYIRQLSVIGVALLPIDQKITGHDFIVLSPFSLAVGAVVRKSLKQLQTLFDYRIIFMESAESCVQSKNLLQVFGHATMPPANLFNARQETPLHLIDYQNTYDNLSSHDGFNFGSERGVAFDIWKYIFVPRFGSVRSPIIPRPPTQRRRLCLSDDGSNAFFKEISILREQVGKEENESEDAVRDTGAEVTVDTSNAIEDKSRLVTRRRVSSIRNPTARSQQSVSRDQPNAANRRLVATNGGVSVDLLKQSIPQFYQGFITKVSTLFGPFPERARKNTPDVPAAFIDGIEEYLVRKYLIRHVLFGTYFRTIRRKGVLCRAATPYFNWDALTMAYNCGLVLRRFMNRLQLYKQLFKRLLHKTVIYRSLSCHVEHICVRRVYHREFLEFFRYDRPKPMFDCFDSFQSKMLPKSESFAFSQKITSGIEEICVDMISFADELYWIDLFLPQQSEWPSPVLPRDSFVDYFKSPDVYAYFNEHYIGSFSDSTSQVPLIDSEFYTGLHDMCIESNDYAHTKNSTTSRWNKVKLRADTICIPEYEESVVDEEPISPLVELTSTDTQMTLIDAHLDEDYEDEDQVQFVGPLRERIRDYNELPTYNLKSKILHMRFLPKRFEFLDFFCESTDADSDSDEFAMAETKEEFASKPNINSDLIPSRKRPATDVIDPTVVTAAKQIRLDVSDTMIENLPKKMSTNNSCLSYEDSMKFRPSNNLPTTSDDHLIAKLKEEIVNDEDDSATISSRHDFELEESESVGSSSQPIMLSAQPSGTDSCSSGTAAADSSDEEVPRKKRRINDVEDAISVSCVDDLPLPSIISNDEFDINAISLISLLSIIQQFFQHNCAFLSTLAASNVVELSNQLLKNVICNVSDATDVVLSSRQLSRMAMDSMEINPCVKPLRNSIPTLYLSFLRRIVGGSSDRNFERSRFEVNINDLKIREFFERTTPIYHSSHKRYAYADSTVMIPFRRVLPSSDDNPTLEVPAQRAATTANCGQFERPTVGDTSPTPTMNGGMTSGTARPGGGTGSFRQPIYKDAGNQSRPVNPIDRNAAPTIIAGSQIAKPNQPTAVSVEVTPPSDLNGPMREPSVRTTNSQPCFNNSATRNITQQVRLFPFEYHTLPIPCSCKNRMLSQPVAFQEVVPTYDIDLKTKLLELMEGVDEVSSLYILNRVCQVFPFPVDEGSAVKDGATSTTPKNNTNEAIDVTKNTLTVPSAFSSLTSVRVAAAEQFRRRFRERQLAQLSIRGCVRTDVVSLTKMFLYKYGIDISDIYDHPLRQKSTFDQRLRLAKAKTVQGTKQMRFRTVKSIVSNHVLQTIDVVISNGSPRLNYAGKISSNYGSKSRKKIVMNLDDTAVMISYPLYKNSSRFWDYRRRVRRARLFPLNLRWKLKNHYDRFWNLEHDQRIMSMAVLDVPVSDLT